MTITSQSTGMEQSTADERLAFLRSIMQSHSLTYRDLAIFTGYAQESVAGWFTNAASIRHRDVPVRAVERLQLELKLGNVKGSW